MGGRRDIITGEVRVVQMKSRCQVCKVMSNSDTFKSSTTCKEYKINYSFNCDSSNVVYLIECNVCGVQYVGSTCTAFKA